MANLTGSHSAGYHYNAALGGDEGMGTGANMGIFQPGAAPSLSGYYGGYKPTSGTAASIDQSQQGQFRTGQQSLVDTLQQQMRGQGPNPAQQQLVAGTNRNLAMQLAAMSSQHGNQNPGQMNQALMRQGGDINQQAAGDAAMLRSQQILGAQGQLGNVLGQARGQDIGLATSQAGLTEQSSLANALAANQAGQFNAGQQAQLGGLMQHQYEYGTNIAQQEFDAKRQQLLGQEVKNTQAQQDSANEVGKDAAALAGGIATGGVGLIGAGAAAAASAAAAANKPHRFGGIVGEEGQENISVGEHGPEMVVPMNGPDQSVFFKHLMGMHHRLAYLEQLAQMHGMH